MKKAPIPEDEAGRLRELLDYQVLDTPDEQGFDDITSLARQITGKPVVLVSLVDSKRQWFKSRIGLGATETPRDISFCGHAIHGEGLFIVEDALSHPDFSDNPLVEGEPRVVFYAGAPLCTPGGYRIGTLCVIDNKPGSLNLEQQAALTRLARQVVAQLELRKRARLLEDACAARSRFIANLSHEIRTPLNAVSGALQLLEQTPLEEDDQRLLSMAQSASETVLELINDVLDMSKIEAGRLELDPGPTDLPELLRSLGALFEQRAKEAGVKLSLSLSPDLPRDVLVDSLRLKQVLLNLLGNAVKFTPPKGNVRLDVQLVPPRSEELGHGIQLTVSDTGIGMAVETLAKLCRPFEQADPSIQSRYGGTGLGLAISQNLVRLLGGELGFVSALGQGTSVSFELHLESTPPSSSAPELEICSSRSPRKTLIVDDVSTNRTILDRMLKKWNLPHCEAASGVEALSSFRQELPDVVLLDLQMPDMDGFEVLKRIREIEAERDEGPPARVIAVTGQAYEADVRECLGAGFDAHIPKPVSMKRLRRLLLLG